MKDSFYNKIKQYRKDNKLTQTQLSELLKVTQVTISRLEKGHQKASKKTIKAFNILCHNLDPKNFFKYLEYQECSTYKVAWFVDKGLLSGDRVFVCKNENQSIILHCDALGHDQKSKIMADYLIISFQAIISSLKLILNIKQNISVEYINSQIYETIKKTNKLWTDQPSFRLLSLCKEQSDIKIITSGMPNMIFINIEKHDDIKELDTSKDYRNYKQKLVCNEKSILFSCSDGLLEILDKKLLESQLQSLQRAFKNDTKAISLKLIDLINENLIKREKKDDISFVLIQKRNT